MRKKISQATQLDFDTGEVVVDDLPIWRQAQARLYEIKNPYVGSKRQIIADIAQELKNNGVEYESVFDLFSGSGVVSLFMKLIGKDVYSNDILTSSYYSALNFVECEERGLTQEELSFLCTHDNSNKTDFVRANYGGKRFTMEEALFLDNYRANVDNLVHHHERLLMVDPDLGMNIINRWCEYTKAAAILTIEHYVINHCFIGGRLNSGQILAKLEHRLQHNRSGNDPNADTMQFNLKPLPDFRQKNGRKYRAFNGDAVETLKAFDGTVDLLYLDPPYGGQQSDYASMFAFCEEYVYGKKLDELPHLASAKKFTKAKDYDDHFREVLSHTSFAKTLAVSYNDSSFADLETIKGILGDFRKEITAVNISHRYKYRDAENSNATEYLLIAR